MRGATSYKGYTAQQHDDAFLALEQLLQTIRPSRILEIGTAGGGLTLFLRDTLNAIGLDYVPIVSYDVVECNWYPTLREHNIDIRIKNLFDHAYLNLIYPEDVVPYIQQEGTTLVLCDGGHKIGEFNELAPHIKVGDFIMAHDYVDTWDNYKQNFVGKIWDWCEVEEKYIADVSEKHNLVYYQKDIFDKVVWVCKTKTQ